MAIFNQDEQNEAKLTQTAGLTGCAQCEAMLADVLDGTLTAEEQARFDLHLATCTACAQMLADAERGAAWLEMLRTPRPEPPAALLERILAQTMHPSRGRVSAAADLSTLGMAGAEAQSSAGLRMATVLPFPKRMIAALHIQSIGHALLQPRLAMTAAMAFFSIGLTLNLTGVRLNELRMANLKPANVRRSFYQADAHLVRYYTNLRVVYELESRVRDLQRATEGESPSTSEPEAKPAKDLKGTPAQKKAHPSAGPGTSRRLEQNPHTIQTLASLRSELHGVHPLAIAQKEDLA